MDSVNLIIKEQMKKIFFKKIVYCLAAISITYAASSCGSDESTIENSDSEYGQAVVMDEQSAMKRFAEILSTATYARQDVREFLKKESLKQFDKNYDVLFIKVKDEHIGNETFKEILDGYAKKGELDAIENTVPTLNVYVANIPVLDVKAENLDCKDSETPVALIDDTHCDLYINGDVVDSIADGQVPGFNLFVVNKNKRVIVNSSTRSIVKTFEFIDPVFDGRDSVTTRAQVFPPNYIGSKAINAFSYFYSNDGSNHSMALQRDYIYYGMTPTSEKGTLNQNVTEYINYIKINPKAYFKMTDTQKMDPDTDDPECKNGKSVSKYKRDFTQEELINEFWTQGAYNIKVEILTSTSSKPLTKYLALKPEEIWNFNLDRSYRHSTGFRHSKYTYTINVNNFTAKTIYLGYNEISLGKWDLSSESLSRVISFVEEDPGTINTTTYTNETSRTTNKKVNGSTKFGLGLSDGNTISTEVEAGSNSSTVQKTTTQIVISRTNKDDELGSDYIYFYDPIIVGRVNQLYAVKEYNTGIVSFGLMAK